MDEIATKFLDLGIQGAQLLVFGFIIWIMIRRDDALREADRIERAGMVSSFENSLMRLVSDFRDESIQQRAHFSEEQKIAQIGFERRVGMIIDGLQKHGIQ